MAGVSYEQDLESPMEGEACKLQFLSLAPLREFKVRRLHTKVVEEISKDTVQNKVESWFLPQLNLSNGGTPRSTSLGGS